MAAIRCRKCSALYPPDMDTCPSCGYSPFQGNTSVPTTPSAPKTFKYSTVRNTPVGKAPVISNLVPCKACGYKISPQAETCPNCGQPTGIHVCPKCGRTNTKVISGASKATSIFMWGPFAANKVMSKYQCKDCGHKF